MSAKRASIHIRRERRAIERERKSESEKKRERKRNKRGGRDHCGKNWFGCVRFLVEGLRENNRQFPHAKSSYTL